MEEYWYLVEEVDFSDEWEDFDYYYYEPVEDILWYSTPYLHDEISWILGLTCPHYC